MYPVPRLPVPQLFSTSYFCHAKSARAEDKGFCDLLLALQDFDFGVFLMKTHESSILLLSLRFHLKGKPIVYVLGVV